MSNPGQTREWWIRHFIDSHRMLKSAPSGNDLVEYYHAFLMVMQDHKTLHERFYTGHEHADDGTVKLGRLR